ncbi:MAG: histidine phosphatase family protein [Pseudomonadota bacterium]
MKTLTLVRHAKSSWAHPELRDRNRPLKGRGERDAPKMGAYLKSQNVKPDRVISSPSVRAWKTAVVFAEKLGIPESDIVSEENIYEAGIYDILRILDDIPEETNHLMLFGHNPSITQVYNFLSDSPNIVENIPTCGVATLNFKSESWFRLRESSGATSMLVFPKNFLA